MNNLDLIAARHAQDIVAKATDHEALDNLATKALGVLQENGVYAATLFLFSRTGKDRGIAPPIREELLKMTSELSLHLSPPEGADAAKALAFVTQHIASDLETLLLVKQIWEQTLIYVRYGAKAGADQRGLQESKP